LVVVSAAAGLAAPIDGPTIHLHDDHILRTNAVAARSLGMGGMFCVHPNQLETVAAVFGTSDFDVSWARKVMEVITEHGDDVFVLDGRMIDEPLIARAKRILKGEHDAGR
jgi:citrate lyase beta subunit